MPSFMILPADRSQALAEFVGPDAIDILHIVPRLDARDVDVLVDDTYSFSVRLGDGGVWSIFQRKADNSGVSELVAAS